MEQDYSKSYVDDLDISNDDILYRRVPANTNKWIYDKNREIYRPNSTAFSDSTIDSHGNSFYSGMSANLKSKIDEKKMAPKELLQKYPNDFLVAIPVSELRNKDQGVMLVSTDEVGHVEVFYIDGKYRSSNTKRKNLPKIAKLIYPQNIPQDCKTILWDVANEKNKTK